MTGLKIRGIDSAVFQGSKLVDPGHSGEEWPRAERGDRVDSFGHWWR